MSLFDLVSSKRSIICSCILKIEIKLEMFGLELVIIISDMKS